MLNRPMRIGDRVSIKISKNNLDDKWKWDFVEVGDHKGNYFRNGSWKVSKGSK